MSWFDGDGAGRQVDVAALMDSQAAELIWEIVAAGALVSIGRTSDGGAVGVTVTLDGAWRREYFREADEMVGWLTGGLAAVRASIEGLPAPAGRRQRPRRRQTPS